MAGYAPKKFRGVSGEDPELWLQEFRQLCESAGLDPAANARTCVRIHGIFESLLEDDARDWFEMHIKGKNWKCANIRNNLAVANLAAANALAQHGQAAVVNTITGADFIPTDIENLINSKIPVIAPSAVPPLAAVLSSSPFSSFQKDVSFQRLVALGYKLGLLRDIDISKISIEDLEAFIDTELNKNLPPNHAYHGNQVFGITQVKIKKIFNSCPKSNVHDSFDSADSSDSTDSDSDSDSYSASRHTCYGLKKRVQKEGVWIRKKEALVQSFINAVPKEIIISVYNALNAEFINYKEPILNQLKGSPSIKT
ncbi:17496_t:CDS:2 [Rhizophagus irregularis]|nr:17496_t:CDS:2 [Rhizophagus irregularis]